MLRRILAQKTKLTKTEQHISEDNTGIIYFSTNVTAHTLALFINKTRHHIL